MIVVFFPWGLSSRGGFSELVLGVPFLDGGWGVGSGVVILAGLAWLGEGERCMHEWMNI